MEREWRESREIERAERESGEREREQRDSGERVETGWILIPLELVSTF